MAKPFGAETWQTRAWSQPDAGPVPPAAEPGNDLFGVHPYDPGSGLLSQSNTLWNRGILQPDITADYVQAADIMQQGGNQYRQVSGLAGKYAAAAAGRTPSIAEMQMRQGIDAAARQQYALAGGARGSDAAAALRGAQYGAGDINARGVAELAQARQREIESARASALQGYGLAGSGYAGIGGQVGDWAGETAGQQLASRQFGFQQMQTGLDAGLRREQSRVDSMYRPMEIEAGLRGAREDRAAREYAANVGALGTALAVGGAVVGGVAGGPAGAMAGGAAGSAAGEAIEEDPKASDIRAKTDIRPAQDSAREALAALQRPTAYPETRRPDVDAMDAANALMATENSRYEYRDPERHGRGEYVGPMAQQFERTPAGRTVVGEARDGTKTLDAGRVALMTAPVVGEQQRTIDRQQAQIDELARYIGRAGVQSQVDDLERSMNPIEVGNAMITPRMY